MNNLAVLAQIIHRHAPAFHMPEAMTLTQWMSPICDKSLDNSIAASIACHLIVK
jgi:hypothetical protein